MSDQEEMENNAPLPAQIPPEGTSKFGYLLNEYYQLKRASVPDKKFSASLHRLYTITDTESPHEFAAILACPPGQVEKAIRRRRIPAWWLLYLAVQRHISPCWILTGEGNRFFTLSTSESAANAGEKNGE